MINPTDDKRFRIGSEIRWLNSNVVDEDTWGVYLQFLAMTPSHSENPTYEKAVHSW